MATVLNANAPQCRVTHTLPVFSCRAVN